MMKKPFLLILFSLLLFNAFGQRQLKGMKSVYLQGGISKLGKFGKIGGSLNTGGKTFASIDLMGEIGEVKTFDFKTYNFTGTFFYTPLNIKDKIFISPGLGITANMSNVNQAKIKENGSVTDLKQFNYGLLGSLQVDLYISNKFVWTTNADQRYFFSNKFGTWAWYAGTGIKYNI